MIVTVTDMIQVVIYIIFVSCFCNIITVIYNITSYLLAISEKERRTKLENKIKREENKKMSKFTLANSNSSIEDKVLVEFW